MIVPVLPLKSDWVGLEPLRPLLLLAPLAAGIHAAYEQALRRYRLAGPTLFNEVISEAARIASQKTEEQTCAAWALAGGLWLCMTALRPWPANTTHPPPSPAPPQ